MRNRAASGRMIEELIRKLTLREKILLLAGRDEWSTAPIPRLKIGSLIVTDGPHGVRATFPNPYRKASPATAFPTGAAMGSCFDPALVRSMGAALAEETLALGCHVLLGPCVNIVRTPLAGRNFETYGEDPYLAGQIGTAWIKGLQSKGVGASLKHFACNNQEFERFRGSSEVDERSLREIYLPAFETAVKEAAPWTVMCAYNRINGSHASENARLLTEILRREWGFKGMVVSDWGAVHAPAEALKAGLDLEMGGPGLFFNKPLQNQAEHWSVGMDVVDAAVRRVLTLVDKAGLIGGTRNKKIKNTVNSRPHQQLALKVARESMVLLKNEQGLLPLDARKVKTLAVIGPNVESWQISGGGSADVEPLYRTKPLEEIRKRCGSRIKVLYAQGCDNFELPLFLSPGMLRPLRGKGKGLTREFFGNGFLKGKAVISDLDPTVNNWHLTPSLGDLKEGPFSVRWSGFLVPPASGRFRMMVQASAECRVFINNKPALRFNGNDIDLISLGHTNYGEASGFVRLEKGRPVAIRVEATGLDTNGPRKVILRLGYAPLPSEDNRLEQAVRLASKADAVLVFAGMAHRYEREGIDRPHMELPNRQNGLISAVAQANSNTAVVLNCGSPVTMPWIDRVKSVLLALYPGQEGGAAAADLLFGRANPSGKLSVSWPVRYEDNPSFGNYPGDHTVRYGEGLYVGYRHYDAKNIKPLFPFGHGLSYTRFEYTNLKVSLAGKNAGVTLEVGNRGNRPGAEVVQLYVSDLECGLARPVRELKGFKKVFLKPGQAARVEFVLDERAFSFYDPQKKAFIAEPGAFEISAGSSSRDLRLKKRIAYEVV